MAHSRLMAEQAHAPGALAGIELFHGGVHGHNADSRLPSIGPSQIAGDYQPLRPAGDDEGRHPRACRATGCSGRARARDAGFDIVYVYGAHTLPAGPVPVAVLQPAHRRVRRLAGQPRALLARDARARARRGRRRLRDRGAASPSTAAARAGIDARREPRVHPARRPPRASVGRQRRLDRASGRSTPAPSRFFAEGWQLEWTAPGARGDRRSRSSASGASRTPTRWPRSSAPACWDLIGAARPVDRRPVPAAARSTRAARRDPRVHRLQRLHRRRPTRTATSAARRTRPPGEEYRRGWHPERFERAANADKDVLVVGAGPAGHGVRDRARQARVRARAPRDADAEIGGCMRWVPRLPGLGEWGRVLDWRRIQLRSCAEGRGDHRRRG